MKPLRVTLAQINTTVGDLDGNTAKVIRALDTARKERSALVLFPELTLTGYPPEDLLFRGNFVSRNLRALKTIASRTRGLAAVVGFVDRDATGRLYNAAAFVAGGRILRVYRKAHLPNYGVFDEKRYFSAGRPIEPIRYRGVRIALTICEDIWQKESFVYGPAFAGAADLVLNLSASPYHAGKQRERLELIRRLAVRARSHVIYLNLVGGQDELVFDGGSLVAAPTGRILAALDRFEEETITFELARPRRVPRPRVLPADEEVYKALVLGTRDYVRKNGFEKALIGVSGGIDSALVAAIAVDALGPGHVVGVTMPSPFTSRGTYEDSRLLCRNLGIECIELRIDGLVEAYGGLLEGTFAGRRPDQTEENLQARIRGNLLMALSNKFGWLVLTTGNKSEFATGYCTLYGDMAGGFAVIKDVPKTLVFRLARYRNRRHPHTIPGTILRRAPSAELKPGQKDRDTLPPYPLLDRFLDLYVVRDLPLERIASRRIPRRLAVQIAAMVDRNEYKRRQSPPGVKITPKAFGRDRRMPITNRFIP
ncbi:MAG: hypothetical protein A3D28_01920 [Omnitrophica bacterium RIFCSPHIGHO2_02_FULL_63_14]|nr:MAG: hypothetical protein A3D28_01920 [Omnitrophica bacterium RIFCSPHIGHO2_02_FULL_63_14]